MTQGEDTLSFKPVTRKCPNCRKHLHIMTEDQERVTCWNCKEEWKVTISSSQKVKLTNFYETEVKQP